MTLTDHLLISLTFHFSSWPVKFMCCKKQHGFVKTGKKREALPSICKVREKFNNQLKNKIKNSPRCAPT